MLSIRPAVEEDVPEIVELLRACVAAMVSSGIDQWDEIYPNARVIRGDIAAATMYLASAGTVQTAAVIVLNERQDPEYDEVAWTINGGRNAVVHRIMVRPDLQGRGVARAMKHFIEPPSTSRDTA